MSQIVDLVDISTLPRAGVIRPDTAGRAEHANSTLDILPLATAHGSEFVGWIRARQRLGQVAELQVGWDSMTGIPPDRQTILFAAKMLAGLERQGIPAPTISPSPDGAVYAEWHARGLDVEIVFEAPYQVIVLIEDAHGEVPPFERETNNLDDAIGVLQTLAARECRTAA